MPRKRQRRRGQKGVPWYRADRDCWCVPGDKAKAPLRDQFGEIVRGKDSQAKAMDAWHKKMSLGRAARSGEANEVKAVLELYLKDAKTRISQKTLKNYTDWFQSFLDCWPGLLVSDLKPMHVREWWEKSHPEWGSSYRNLSGSAFKAAMNWAAKPGKGGEIIPRNPLDGMSLPAMRKRSSEVVVTEEEFGRLLELVSSEEVRDILVVAWETGTRPVNLSRATAQNVTEEGNALLFADWNSAPESTVHKTFKRTGRPLVVPLPPKSQEIVQKLLARYPDGPLFRTTRGLVWTEHRLANIIRHYAKRAGLEGRFTPYSCRHSRATALLEQGASDVDVAAVLGNTPGVIHRNYSHVGAKVNRLLDIMKGPKATEETRSPSPGA